MGLAGNWLKVSSAEPQGWSGTSPHKEMLGKLGLFSLEERPRDDLIHVDKDVKDKSGGWKQALSDAQ